MRELSQTTIAITGGSRGIGAALRNSLRDAGATVFWCSTSEHSDPQSSAVDISDADAVSRWADSLPKIDVLIHNAAVLGFIGSVAETPVETWNTVTQVNVNGTFYVLRAFEARLNDNALVINLSSSVGRKARKGWGGYSTSKFALEALTQICAQEWTGKTVVSVNPGGTATDMRASAAPDEDPTTIPSAADVASVIANWIRTLTADDTGAQLNVRDQLSSRATSIASSSAAD